MEDKYCRNLIDGVILQKVRTRFQDDKCHGLHELFFADYIETISSRLIFFIKDENAHSRYFSEDAYEMDAEPKISMLFREQDTLIHTTGLT